MSPSPKQRKVSVKNGVDRTSPPASPSNKKDKNAPKTKKRVTRRNTIIGAILIFIVLFLVAAFLMGFFFDRVNQGIKDDVNRQRAAEAAEAAAEKSFADSAAAVKAAATEEVKKLDPGFGDMHVPDTERTTTADGTGRSENDGDSATEPEDVPSRTDKSTGDDGTCSGDSTECQASGKASIVAETIAEQAAETGDQGSSQPSGQDAAATDGANSTETTDAGDEEDDAISKLSSDGFEKWEPQNDLETLIETIGEKLPEGHKSLVNAEFSQCPFSKGRKLVPKKFLIEPESEAFTAGHLESDLTNVKPLLPDKATPPVSVPAIQLKSGREMPAVGLGMYNVASRKGLEIAITALNIGYRMFDTSQLRSTYNEEIVGLAIAQSDVNRSEVFVSTKVDGMNLTRDYVFTNTNASLDRLGVDYLDLLVLNRPFCDSKCETSGGNPNDLQWRDAWTAMEDLHRAGVVRDLGVGFFSFDNLKELVAMATVPVSVVQARFDPMYQNSEMRAFCREKGIVFQALSVLGHFWVDLPEYELNENPLLGHVVLENIAKEHMSTPASAVIAWALDQDVAVIPSTRNVTHLQENLAAAALSLGAEETAAIAALDGAMEARREVLEHDRNSEMDRSVISGENLSLQDKIEMLAKTTLGDLGVGAVKKEVEADQAVLLVPLSDDMQGGVPTTGVLMALDPSTGDSHWSFDINGGIFAQPTVSADRTKVFLATSDWHVYGMMRRDARLLWEYHGEQSFAASVLQDDNSRIYASDMGGHVHVLDAESGNRVRRDKYGNGGFFTGTISTAEKTLFLMGLDPGEDNFFAVDYVTGKTRYELDLSGSASSHPVMGQDGKILYAAGAGHLLVNSKVSAISLQKQKKIWRKDLGLQDEFAPAISLSKDGKVLYSVHPAGFLQVFDARKGSLLNEVTIAEGPVYAAPVEVNSTTLLQASGDGWLYLICLTRSRYFEFKNMHSPILHTPVLRDGKLYVALQDGRLVKIDMETRKVDWKKIYNGRTFNAALSIV